MIRVKMDYIDGNTSEKEFHGCRCDAQRYIREVVKLGGFKQITIVEE